jgi:hypothetical protein
MRALHQLVRQHLQGEMMPEESWWQSAAQVAGPLLGAFLVLALLFAILNHDADPPAPAEVTPRIVLEPLPRVDVSAVPTTTLATTTTTTTIKVFANDAIGELYELDHDQGEGKVLVREVRLIEVKYPVTTFTRSLGDHDVYHITIDTCTNGFGQDWFDINQWMFEFASECKGPDIHDLDIIQEWIGVMPIVCDLVPPIYQD